MIILACAAVLCVIGIVAAITLSSGGYDAELQAAATHSEKVDGGYENSVIIQVRNDSSEESLTGMEVQAGGMSVVCTGCIPAGEEGLLAQTWFSGEPVGEILFDDEENVCSFDSAAPFEFRQMEAFIMDHGDNVTMETNHDEEGYATDWNDDDFAKYAIEIDNHNDMSFAAGETIGVAVIFREGKLSEGDVFYNGLESIEAEASSTDFAVLPKKLAEKDEVQLIILPKFEEVYQ